MAEDLGERTEEATPKRLQDAREEGRVPKSADAAAAALLLVVVLMLFVAMTPVLGELRLYLERALGVSSGLDLIRVEAIGDAPREALVAFVRIGLPLLFIAWLAAYGAHFWQVGWLFTSKALAPKLEKINPINGFKRIFGLQALVKATLDSAKVAAVLLVAVLSIMGMSHDMLLLPNLSMIHALAVVGWMMFDLALRILAVLAVLGLIDFIWQRWKHRRDLRMTKTEVKEEMKHTDGDPETKKRRQRLQQQIAMQRLRTSVPRADVIVTNPEHISIAIQYDEKTMRAPRVVAKGQDYVALRIRQIAMQHGIPIVERKPLARALYRGVEVGQEIPPEFYQAVAEILAYVFRLANRKPAATPA
ncbi:MAG: flagellar biosynthesis protein FlhB [Phycisphaeraceae bacterium]|nr:MAG: flagellar biosynthesis protein FlhB [Phycisphaeraceae bacterium]